LKQNDVPLVGTELGVVLMLPNGSWQTVPNSWGGDAESTSSG